MTKQEASRERERQRDEAIEREALQAEGCTLEEWVSMGRDAERWLGRAGAKEGGKEGT